MNRGLFYRFTGKKKNHLIKKFKKLTRQVNELRWQMKLVAVGGAVSTLTPTQDVVAQSNVGPFVLQSRAHNPLRWPLIDQHTKPTTVDLDNDGDFDFVVGAGPGYSHIRIYLNEGTAENPGFTEFLALDQNGNAIYQYGGSPAFADLNGDGDLDMIFGLYTYSADRIQFWVGNGGIPGDGDNPLQFTEQTGAWDQVLKTGNPFYSILPGESPTLSFVNFDEDGDLDILIGHEYSNIGDGEQLHYYENDGNSNFSLQPFGPGIVGSDSYRALAQMADMDEDGNSDLILGRQYGDLLFYKGDGAGNFSQQSGPWDSGTKSGNPFFGIDKGVQSAPVLVDLDNDGDLDLVMGFQQANKYNVVTGNSSPLSYFENTGDAVFEEKILMENPFDGIDVGNTGIPNFVEIDGDGDLDAVLGGKYDYSSETPNDRTISVLENLGNGFSQPLEDHPILGIRELAVDYELAPIFVNLDADADLEVVAGTAQNGIQVFDLVDGAYTEIAGSASPFYGIFSTYFDENIRVAMGDIDGDGDLDMFVGGDLYYPYQNKIRYFENTGTSATAEFTERTGSENLLSSVANDYESTPHLVDIDNDGDLDAIVTEAGFDSDGGGDILVFENTGTTTSPEFTLREDHPIATLSFREGYRGTSIGFIDFDQDGDNDFFIGVEGQFEYYTNDNPAPTTSVNSATLDYEFDTGPIIVDAALTLADSDGDFIVGATVTIQSYQEGNEILSFTAQAPIIGSFDNTTGVLTLQGKATVAAYQSVLRMVTYSYNGPDPGARKGKAGKVKAVTRTIAFQTLDEDLTTPSVATRTINIASQGNAPVIAANTLTTIINNSASIDLTTIISDPDGNLDPLSFAVLPNVSPTPARVGIATISGNILTIDYAGTNFAGTDYVTIEACDLIGLCTTAEIQIDVAGEVIVRNGVSPNGDGLNDFFRLDNITALGQENKVMIFNRWGDKVFETENYDNSTRRFDGTSDDGKDLPSGIYFYKIEFVNGSPELEGYLTLKR